MDGKKIIKQDIYNLTKEVERLEDENKSLQGALAKSRSNEDVAWSEVEALKRLNKACCDKIGRLESIIKSTAELRRK